MEAGPGIKIPSFLSPVPCGSFSTKLHEFVMELVTATILGFPETKMIELLTVLVMLEIVAVA
jgi:hypothetical protein